MVTTQWDADGIDETSASVLSERAGLRNGRVYHIDYIATDVYGASCGGEVIVKVDHSSSQPAVDDGRLYPSVPSDNQCGRHSINNPPYIISEPTTSATSCNKYEYTILANDPDEQTLTYFIVSAPEGVVIDENTGEIVWEQPEAGIYEIIVRVEDSDGEGENQRFTLEVTTPELLITSTPVTETTADETYIYNVDVQTDLENPPSYSLLTAPDNMMISAGKGEITWQPLAVYNQGIITPDPFCAVPIDPESTNVGYADVVAVVDESGSMSTEHRWIGDFIARLEQGLLDEKVGITTENLYGLVGFEYYPREILVGGQKLGTAAEFVQAANSLKLYGGTEDGWKSLQHVLDTYPLRPEAAGNMILITDEDRDSTTSDVSYSSLLSTIREKGVILNSVVNAKFRCEDGKAALGVDFTGTGYVADGAGGFKTCTNAYAYSGFGGTIAHYVNLALDTQGAAWDLNYLRSGGHWAQSFSSALINIKVKEIVRRSRSLPDLTPTNIRIDADETSLSVDLVNRGGMTVDVPVTVQFYDGISLAESSFLGAVTISDTIAANGSVPVTLPIAEGMGEIHNILIQLDVGGQIEECHLDNNTVLAPVTEVLVSGECDSRQQQIFAINVFEPNVSPHILTTSLPNANVGQEYLFKINAEDTNIGDGIGYELNVGPEGMSIDSLSGELRWQPLDFQAATHEVTVTVRDIKGLEESKKFTLTAVVNHAPVVTSTPVDAGREGEKYVYEIIAEDIDGNSISYSLVSGPEGAIVDVSTGMVSWTPTADQLGENILEVKVADDAGASIVHQWLVTVVPANSLPQFISEPPKLAVVDQPYSYSPQVTDVDGDTLSFSIVSAPVGMTMDSNGTIQWLPQFSQNGIRSVSIKVDDGQGGTAEQSFSIVVTSPPPSITFTSDADTVVIGDSTRLHWLANYAESVSIDRGIGEVELTGSRAISPVSTSTYTITATGPGGSTTSSITVSVIPYPIPEVSLGSDPGAILLGNSTNLTWSSSNADTLSIEPGIGDVASQGSVTVTPSVTTAYTITATGPGGTVTSGVVVDVFHELLLQLDSPVAGLSTTSSTVTVSGQVNNNAGVTVNDNPVQVSEGQFSTDIELTNEGQHTFTVIAVDSYGQKMTITRAVEYSYPELILQIDSPVDGTSTNEPAVMVSGRVTNNANVTVNGNSVQVSEGQFSTNVELTSQGQHTITVVATDSYGQQETVTRTIEYSYPELTLQIDSPLDGTPTTSSTVTVSGQVTNNADVALNGNPVQVNEGLFTTNIELTSLGQHTVTIVATDSYGQEKIETIHLTYLSELLLSIDYPGENETFYDSPLHVVGQVSNGATVHVNGVEATVSENSYTALVPLAAEGAYTLTVIATDQYGQQKTEVRNVFYVDIPAVTLSSDKYRVKSGDSVELSWESENCERAVLEPGIGEVDCTGSAIVSVTETTEFVIESTGAGKTARDTAVIVVDDPYGDPTPEEQAHLEAINWARANPLAEAARLNIDLNEGPPEELINDTPVPPLTFNEKLMRAARGHSRDMVDNDYFAHEGSDGTTPAQRCEAEGYIGGTGENIATRMSQAPLDSYETSLNLHDDLFLDIDYPGRGHRVNILGQDWTEVGIGYIHESVDADFSYGGTVTCNFGSNTGRGYSLLGVVYMDSNSDQFYDLGEGVSGAIIRDLKSGTVVYSASAGGYSLPLTDGAHTIQVTLPDGKTLNKQLLIAGANVKYDFRVTMFAGNKPSVELTSQDLAIRPGESTQLVWQSTEAQYAEIDNNIGYVPVNGSMTVSPSQTTTYSITATGENGTTTATVTVQVSDFVDPPIVQFFSSASTIGKGEVATLSWNTTDANQVYIDNGIGDVPLSGSILVQPDHTSSYTLTATSPGGVESARVTVHVTGDPIPQPAGSFGALYNNQVPADATIESYAPERFSLVTGKVENISGVPLVGVMVTILDHPEYGSVTTNTEGEFILPVEGGTTHTIIYHLENYLPVQRQVYVPVNDIAIAENVQMVQQDTRSTEVILDGNSATVITHRSTPVTDQSGSRAVTLVFQGDIQAYVTDEEGNDIRQISRFTTRATEYQTPESMPAELPKTSAFTFCAEFQVDGVKRVRFSKPVISYVDNFLGFDVGTAVPAGYYDRDKGVWVAMQNGVVVTLLDTDSDGVVDGVDSDGDGLADDLNNNGDIHDEALGLTDSTIYQPDSTYWRVEMHHFSPGDFNWCSFLKLLDMFGFDVAKLLEQLCPDCPKSSPGSAVGNESQVFYEEIAIPGTGLTLTYASDRTDGFKNVISVPVSGDEVPADVKRIVVEVNIAGRTLTKTLEALPNQVAEFVWDGRDLLNNRVLHKVTAHVNIGFVYDSYYMDSGFLKMAFGQFGTTVTSVPTRDEVINWRRSELEVNPAEKGFGLAQGWTVSAHHILSPTDPTTLHKGDGSVVRNTTSVIAAVAGNGADGWPEDGADAFDTPIGNPVSTAMDAEGNLYVANQVQAAILKVDPSGVVEVVAGGMYGTSEEEGIDAKLARIHIPNDIAFDSRGNLYVADMGNNTIRKIDTDGIITTVAGNGNRESTGDGGPAVLAGIIPSSIAVDDYGSIYFAEASSCMNGEVDPVTGECTGGDILESSYRVRKISTNGIVRTIAGTGEQYSYAKHGFVNGDGGPANEALLSNPSSVSVDQDGNLYIADGLRIRKVNASGIITTVAGNGASGYTGDGGPATSASITHASGIVFDNRGNFYFSQYYGNGDVIRKVSSDGYISTVAGKGEPGLEGDAGPASRALLMQPHRLSIDSRGFIIIPDRGNKLIRKVAVKSYSQEETHFTEPNGLGHLISTAGLHTLTYDLETGRPLLTFGYDTNGRLQTITDQFGNVVTIVRTLGVPTAIISPDGWRTNLDIDEYNQLKTLTYPDGNAFTFEYQNNNGLLTAKNEPNGNRFEHFFDENGRVYKATNSENGVWEYSKEIVSEGLVTSSTTTPNTSSTVKRHTRSTGAEDVTSTSITGEVTTSSTSADGLDSVSQSTCGPKVETSKDLDQWFGHTYMGSLTVSSPDGLSLTTETDKTYVDTDNDGLLESVTQTVTTNGEVTTVEHDIVNATRTVTSPEGRIVTSEYDPYTLQLTSSSVPGLLDSTYEYRTDGKPLSVTTGERTMSYTYDSSGNIATITDPMNRVTSFTDYDAMGRVKRVVRPDTSVLQYDYDENGNMTLYRTAKPADNTFGFNGVNKRENFVTPLGSTTSYTYDEERRLTKVTLPSTKEIVNSYIAGKLDKTITPEWTNIYTYACGDNVDTITRGTEVLDYGYDGNLVTSMEQSGTVTASLGFSYNNDFQLASFSYGGLTESMAYDDDGLLTEAGSFVIGRNVDNGLPESVSDDIFTLTRNFNGYGEVDTVTTDVSAASVYSYDLSRYTGGRIKTKTETIKGVSDQFTYTYDDLGRLLTVHRDGTLVEEYRYDNNGNRTYQMNSDLGITGRTFAHSDEDHTMTAGPITYEFDFDDHLAARIENEETTEYVYSASGELLSVTKPDTTIISYVHDPLGRRIAKKVNGTIIEKYLWSGQTTLLAVYDGSDNLLQRFEYADGRMPVAMTSGGSVYYLAYDQVGSLRAVTDSVGNIVKEIQYDSFGNILSDSNPTFTVPFGFAGGLHDRDTGLVRFGYRDYLPEIGKWTAKDPIDFTAGDSNLYGYVKNDPVNFIDPYGLYSFDEFVQDAANYSAGFGDTISFGLTDWVRDQMGTNDVVDKCSGAYGAGELSGYAWEAGMGAAGAGRALGWTVNASRYQHGGGGVNLLKNGTRKFGADWHSFKYKGKMGSRPHYHRGKTKSQMKKHRPWQGGW